LKRLVFTGIREYKFENVVTPKIKHAGDVLIEIKGIGICGTDMHIFSGNRKVKFPHVSGHECVGIVKEIGTDVKNIKVGDYVTVEPNFSCRKCDYCLGGMGNLCLEKKCIGLDLPGCFSEMIIAPEDYVWKLPESISIEEGVVIETATVALHAINKANIKLEDKILIVGAGSVGLLALQFAKLSGAAVHISDVNKKRLQIARELGADYTYNVNEQTLPSDFDIVIDAAGAPGSIKQTVHLVKNGGRVVFVGIPGKPIELDLMTIIRHEIEILGSVACTNEFSDVISLIDKGKLDAKKIATHKLAFKDLVKGIELMEKQEALKPVVIL
jgi:L-iditol 2-dehydrogenase